MSEHISHMGFVVASLRLHRQRGNGGSSALLKRSDVTWVVAQQQVGLMCGGLAAHGVVWWVL